ncbi:hypothetical protein ABZT03_31230 [Streptomyces sp. NPDC005574]|uniref:hypothetical protein n=1 Tax=Streptomyces sp. NPDC005574 TaxID=3156891 RepID=UPI0033B24C30
MTIPASSAAQIPQWLHPFRRQPHRWERKRSRAVRGGHVCCGPACAAGCEPVLIRERTAWGWIDWSIPADGSLPQQPSRMAVFTPYATRSQRLALHWLARRPTHRYRIAAVTVRPTTAVITALTLVAATLAYLHGIPLSIVVPAAALVPLVVEDLPAHFDARARAHARIVEAEAACRYLQRLAAVHADLVQAATVSDAWEGRRAVEVGHSLLFDAADLLQCHDTRIASSALIARERLMLHLAAHIGQITASAAAASFGQDGRLDQQPPPGHHLPKPRRPAQLSTDHTSPHSPKEEQFMPHPQDNPEQARAVYLLFAHEAYYTAASQEINTTLVAAASLLHPRVRQPDGARIYQRLTRGRRQCEIVPLSTLTHELDGGIRWPEVGDWEAVTADLLQLIQDRACDALSLRLPDLARALVCSGPHTRVRIYDPVSGRYQTYGPADRIEVLIEVGRQLATAEAGQALWPGDGLLPSPNPTM